MISPIGEMGWKDKHVVVNGGEIGSLTQKLYDTLTGIQWGVEPDPYGWTVKLQTGEEKDKPLERLSRRSGGFYAFWDDGDLPQRQ